VAVEGLTGTGSPAAQSPRTWWLIALTLVGWALVGTMRYWWAWLWARKSWITLTACGRSGSVDRSSSRPSGRGSATMRGDANVTGVLTTSW